MNAPEKLPAESTLALDLLHPSPTNPRTRTGLDPASLNEMAASIKAVGIMQPILVRDFKNKPGIFEIIAGERRWRAAKIAGLKQVPILKKDVPDDVVIQMQLLENTEREDLSALEEAEGYEKLMAQVDGEGKPYTADRIAELRGVSRSTIYAKLKILDLCQKARDALYEKKIDFSIALLIARVSPEKIQLEALKDILEQGMSYRQAREHILRHCMLDMNKAIFDIKDATLVKKAGACTDCPKRTGNQPDLFSDMKGKDGCTDTVCYAMKKAAHFLNVRNQAEAEGAKVITGDAAKKIIPYNHVSEWGLQEKGYALPTSKIPNDPKNRTWEQAVKQTKADIKPDVIENPHQKGEVVQAFSIEEATKKLRQAGFEVTLRNSCARPEKTEKEKAADAKLKLDTKAENRYRQRLIAEIHAQAEKDLTGTTPNLRPSVFRLLAIEIFDNSKSHAAKAKLVETHLGEAIAKKGSWEANKLFKEHLAKLHPQQCMQIMIDLVMAQEEKAEDWQVRNKDKPETLLALAAIHEIDADAIKAQASKEIKEEADAKAKAKSAKKPAAKKAPAKLEAEKPAAKPATTAKAEPAKASTKPAAKKPAAQATKAAPTTAPAAQATAPAKNKPECPFPSPGAQKGGEA